MVNRVLVLGGGTAGFIAAISLKVIAPRLNVTVLRSVALGVIGVGEGTTSPVPNYLHHDLKMPHGEFMRKARPTIKLGIKFLWGPREKFNFPFRAQYSGRYNGLAHDNGYYVEESTEYATVDNGLMSHDLVFERQPNGLPIVANNFGYHLENTTFVAFLESYAAGLGITLIDDTVAHVEENEQGVSALVCGSGRRCDADLYVDASGFVSVLLGKTLKEPFRSFSKTLFCDRAVIGGWDTNGKEVIEPYTTAETMNAGWCWRIDHENRVNRGYVHSSAFLSPEEAEKEFRAKNPRVTETKLIKFVSGNYQRGWVKNVVGIGNAAGFVEPLEATSIAVLCRQSRNLAQTLADPDIEITDGLRLAYNRWQTIRWDLIRNFLSIHYRFNTRLDTEFWKACRNDVDLATAADFIKFYQDVGPNQQWTRAFIDGVQIYENEGYLCLLTGMKVPYKQKYKISEADKRFWGELMARNRQRAINGMNMQDSMEVLRRPDLQVPEGYFQPMS